MMYANVNVMNECKQCGHHKQLHMPECVGTMDCICGSYKE